MDSDAPIDLLLSLPRYTAVGAPAYKPGLDRMHALLEGLDNPQEAFSSIHVAGTNGKGSTASMIASIGSALGLKVGLHTSPHLVDVTERMRLNGVPAPRSWLEEAVTRHRHLLDSVEPSFFEATAALGLLYFAEAGADFAVVEVGMGGRLDATNVLMPVVAAITRIGLDHVEHLGPNLAAIAREKAGIVKPGLDTVLYPAPPDVRCVVQARCKELRAPLHAVDDEVDLYGIDVGATSSMVSLATPDGCYSNLTVSLSGAHQIENASIAVRASEIAWGSRDGFQVAVREGLATISERAGLRGRLEVFLKEPLVIADVAHNPDGLEAALRAVQTRQPDARLCIIIAAMADKDVGAIGKILASHGASVFCVSVNESRAFDAADLANALDAAGADVHGHGTLEDGLKSILQTSQANDVLLVTGSHSIVGQLVAADEAGRLSEYFGTAFV